MPIGVLLQQESYTSKKAQSAKDSERCPDCDSVNYMRSPQQPNSMKQCYDCGYNERFLHTTHGASGIGQKDLPTYNSRVQNRTAAVEAQFGPMGSVVGHV